jgi:hypothetical protein
VFFAVLLGDYAQRRSVLDILSLHLDALERVRGVGKITSRQFAQSTLIGDLESPFLTIASHNSQQLDILIGAEFPNATPDELFSSPVEGEYLRLRITEGASTSVLVKSDTFASWPAYYSKTDNLAIISNDPILIALGLGIRQLDVETCFELLCFGHSISDRTTIQGVNRLPRNSILGVSFEGKTLSEYSVIRYLDKIMQGVGQLPQLSRLEVFEILRASASRLLAWTKSLPFESDVSFQLSGGMDSRLMCGAISATNLQQKGKAITYEMESTHELSIAKNVAAKLRLPHETRTFDSCSSEDLRSAFLLTGGQVAIHAAAGNYVGYKISMASTALQFVFGAWPGDLIAGSCVPIWEGILNAENHQLILDTWAALRGYGKEQIGAVANKKSLLKYYSSTRDSLRQSLASISGKSVAQVLTKWAIEIRQPAFSFVSPARMLGNVIELTPCLDSRFVRHFIDLDAQELVGKLYYRGLLIECLPHLRDIPISNTGRPVSAEPAASLQMPSVMCRNSMRSKVGVLLRRIGLRKPKNSSLTPENTLWTKLLSSIDVSSSPFSPSVNVDLQKLQSNVAVQLYGCQISLAWTFEYLNSRTRRR